MPATLKYLLALISWFLYGLLPLSALGQTSQSNDYNFLSYRDEALDIMEAALGDDQSFQRLTYFTDKFGHRFSGSKSLEQSIDWIVSEMNQEPFDNVKTQKVMVPHWVRGEESVTLLSPRKKDLPMLGLGGSVGTPKGGIEADVLVVNSFDDLYQHAEQAKGKIVVYNMPFITYGQTVKYRYRGAIEAAKVGAVASLIRSVSPYSMQTPHTGNSAYENGVKKIPQAAITIEDAALLQRLQKEGVELRIHLSMDAKTLPDVPSRNIIAEIKGSEKPEEIVVLGGHIDSWDVGQGAMDDAGGSFAAWEAAKLIKTLGLTPKRTIRVVMWTNEENGLRGAKAYRDMVKEKGMLKNHILAIESDGGVFDPKGFGFTGSEEAFKIISGIGRLLEPLEANKISRGGGGADIAPLMDEGVPGMGLLVDSSRYFWYHHTAADTIDKLDPKEYQKCIATMAIMAYVVADIEKPLPR